MEYAKQGVPQRGRGRGAAMVPRMHPGMLASVNVLWYSNTRIADKVFSSKLIGNLNGRDNCVGGPFWHWGMDGGGLLGQTVLMELR